MSWYLRSVSEYAAIPTSRKVHRAFITCLRAGVAGCVHGQRAWGGDSLNIGDALVYFL